MTSLLLRFTRLLPFRWRRSPLTRPAAGPAFLPMLALLASLGLAVGLFAFLVWPAYAQDGDQARAPSNLTAELADGQVTLNWDAPAEDAASVTGYEILRRRPKQGEETLTILVADTGSTATAHVDGTANEPGQRYVYRVKALRGEEKSRWSNYARIDLPKEAEEPETTPEPTPEPTPEAAEEPPAKPTGLSAVATHDTVTLTWDAPQDDTITGYVILRRNRDTDAEGEFSTLVEDTAIAAAGYTDNSVAPETPYTYRIKAINEQGVSERSRWFHIDTPAAPTPEPTPAPTPEPTPAPTPEPTPVPTSEPTPEPTSEPTPDPTPEEADEPPEAPTGLSAVVSHDQVVLTWDDPQDDSITGYVILRRNRDTDAEGEFTNVVNDTGTADTTRTDDSVAAETPYTYRIQAINQHGVSERSRWVHIDTPSAPEPPAKPTGVLSAASSETVILDWDDPEDDSITGYRILRRDQDNNQDGGFQTLVEDTGSAATTYTDDTVEPERSYVYRVLAISPHGVSAPSHDVEAQTPADPNPADPNPADPNPAVPEREGVQDLGDITEQDGPQFNRGALEGAADAAHYYRFTLSEPRSVRLALHWQEGNAALVLELEDGTRLRVRVPDGDAHASVEETLLEGTHYARVEARQQGENEYLFTYEVSEASAADVELLREEGYTPDPEPGEVTEPLVSQPAETRQETEQVLLSNFGQRTSPDNWIVRTFELAQGFRTGPNIPGYTLSSIKLDVLRVPNNLADLTVELWSATSASTPKPDAQVATLTHSTGTWETGLNTFDAPADTELAAGTTFFVFASYAGTHASDGLGLKAASSTSADDDGAPGWSVRQIFERSRTSQGSWSSRSDVMKIQINGSVVLGPSSSDTPGTVVLSAASPFSASQPYTGIELTAELTDPDPVVKLEWQWHRSKVTYTYNESSASWQNIPGANSSSYTPTENDESRYLRATASYKQAFTDGTLDRTAHGVTGDYTRVDISEPPGVDFVLSQDSPGRVRVGKWVTGYFGRNETGRPGDAFAVDLERGRKYRIDLEGSDTGRGSLADPRLENVFYLVGSTVFSAPIRFDDNSGKGKNAQITFTADATATHYIGTGGLDSFGTYRLTVQEIVDDLGVWYTDWGAEELGGFLHPYHPGTGKLYNKWIIERNRGQRDVDGFLFYLGSDDAPLDSSDYILTVRGQKTPRIQVQTFYDLSNLDDYIAEFSLADDFIEFPTNEGVHPGEGTDAEAGRISPVAPRPVGTMLGTSQEEEYHLVFNPGTEDIGAYLATISSHQKYDTGRYEIALRRDASMSEPEGEDFGALAWYTKGYVRVGDPVTGHIGEEGTETDVFASLLRAGRTYLIEAKGSETGDGTLEDPWLSLGLAKPGSLGVGFANATEFPCPTIADCADDDSGTGLNARIVYSPSETNLFYIEVTNLKAALGTDPADPSEEGTYTLSVTDVTGEPGY